MALHEHKRTNNIRIKINILNGHLRDYESISGIPIYKMEIKTTESTTSVDVCLTVGSLAPPAHNTK
jgi:hypothetical protein